MTELASTAAISTAAVDAEVIPIRRSFALPDLIERFERDESHQNPDEIVPLRALRMTPDATLELPNGRTFAFTDWSRKQLSSLLGMRWDKWFENATPEERAEELNRRMQRAGEDVKLRTTQEKQDDVYADGTLRAFVTPGYSPVEDSNVGRLVMGALQHIDTELTIVRADITDRSSSFVVAVGKPYKVGGDGQVGDLWGGILVRNSGVGFASLLMVASLLRLFCRNGMACPIGDSVILKRRHRGLDDKKLRWQLADSFKQLPAQLRAAGDVLQLSASRPVIDVEQTVRSVLQEANLPLRFLQPVVDAYGKEPSPTAFGISQALTLAAQQFSPEERLELETAAGTYLRETTPAMS